MPRITIYATIVDADMPPTGQHYKTAFQSHSLANAREKKQWDGNKDRLVVAHWRRNVVEPVEVVQVPSGRSYAAKIYKMSPQ